MSIILDHQLREKMAHDASAFPISYFQDELALLPNQAGPLHLLASGTPWRKVLSPSG